MVNDHTKRATRRAGLLCIALIISVGFEAHAGGHTEGAPAFGPPEGFTIGLGVIGSNGIYVGEDSSTRIAPILRYDSDAFSIGLPDGLRVTAFGQGDFRLSGIIAPRFNDLGGSDAAELAGIDREEITVDGGLQLDYAFGFGTELQVRAVTDLSGEHDGSELSLSVEQVLPLGGVPIFVGAGLTYQTSDLAGYLYGVAANEATATRATYDPGAVLIPSISVGTRFSINENVGLFAQVEAAFLPSEVTDSSIVDEDLSLGAFVGISYNF